METNICIAGFGGQGVMSFGSILSDAVCSHTDLNVTFFPSYGAEQRGGTANCFVVISDGFIGNPMPDELDELVVLNYPSYEKFLPRLKKGGRLFVNSSLVPETEGAGDVCVVSVPASDAAIELGNIKVLNILMLGVYLGYSEIIGPELVWKSIEKKFSGKKAGVLEMNKKAYDKGLEMGRELRDK